MVGAGADEEVVPDVLGLPEVDLEGEIAEGDGDVEGHLEGGPGGDVAGGGGLKANHGAFHALSGGVGELGSVEGDLISCGSGEEGLKVVGLELFGFEGAAEVGVEGVSGGEGEGWGNSHAGLGEEMKEGGVVVVDLAQGVFHLGEGAVEDGAEDAVLLVGEEGGEGVVDAAEEAFKEMDDVGEVGFADGYADGGAEVCEAGDLLGISGVELADGGGEVLVAEVEDGVGDLFGLLGDLGAELRATEGKAAAAGGEDFVAFTTDVEAEDLAGFGVVAEDGGDGVVGTDLFESDAKAGDVAAIDFGAVAEIGDIAFGFGEEIEEGGLEGGADGAEEASGELEDAAGVGDDLDGLDAGDLVKEPAAGGVHELGVATELHELPDGRAFFGGELAGGVLGEETIFGGGGAIEDDVDVSVAGGPEIVKQRLGDGFGEGAGAVTEEVKGIAEGSAPLLVPAGLAAVAAAVRAPALDSVKAGPRGVFGDLGLPLGWEAGEELGVVGELGVAAILDPVEGVTEGHFAVLVVVAVAFAVGGDVGELGLGRG